MKKLRGCSPFFPLIILLCALVFLPFFLPYSPSEQSAQSLHAPSFSHIAGTDILGRDVFTRVIFGARVSLLSCLTCVAIMLIIGVSAGIWAGYASRLRQLPPSIQKGKRKGRKNRQRKNSHASLVSGLIMRACDVSVAFPVMVIALAALGASDRLAGGMGKENIGGVIAALFAVACVGWPKYARLSAVITRSVLASDYMRIASLSGHSPYRIAARHLLRAVSAPILTMASLDIGTVMMEIAGLSFIGLGVQPPVAELGAMLSDSRSMLAIAPWLIVAPGLAMVAIVACFHIASDHMRDSGEQAQLQW